MPPPTATPTGAGRPTSCPSPGPPREPIELPPAHPLAAAGLTMGRSGDCDLPLDPTAATVSRRHARFAHDPIRGRWSVADAGSSWGTFVNGRRLDPDRPPTPLAAGDLVRVEPWTFLVADSPRPRGLDVAADAGSNGVRSVAFDDVPQLRADRLGLLLAGAASLQEAADVDELCGRLIDLAVDGTGLANAAVLRPLDAAGRYDVLAAADGNPAGFTFSRSLLDAARRGEVAEVAGTDDGAASTSRSIVQMQITRAVCVPVLLGRAVRACCSTSTSGARPSPAARTRDRRRRSAWRWAASRRWRWRT